MKEPASDRFGAAPSTTPDAHPSATGATAASTRSLARLARFMDSAIVLPGGFRIGWDGIIGLIPGIGDLIGLAVSSWIVVAAARLGVPRSVLLRMLTNVGIESLVGVVPIVGDLFDFVFKANERNLALATRALDAPVRTRRASRAMVAAIVLGVIAFVVFVGWAIVALAALLIALLGSVF